MPLQPPVRPDDVIAVMPAPARHVAPLRPAAPWLFAAAMAGSMVISIAGGLVLGYLAATGHGLGDSHWSEAVQSHGRLQLFGWTAVFVVALLFEFTVRLNQSSALPVGRRATVLGAIALGPTLSALGQLGVPPANGLMVAGAIVLGAGALGAAWLIASVHSPRPLRDDIHPLWMRASAGWLALAAVANFAAIVRADDRIVALPEAWLVNEVTLRGFVMFAIVGVGLRAFPGHLGLSPVTQAWQQALLACLALSVAGSAVSAGAFGLPASDGISRVADIAFAAALLMLTWRLGVLRALRRPAAGERYALLVPVAWLGLVAYAVALSAQAVAGDGSLTLYEEGAVRHIFMLGFMAPLMAAMAHIVLARFGTGRLYWENRLTTAFVLLVAATPLRVLPGLVSDSPGAIGRNLMATAMLLTAIGLGLMAAVALRTVLALRSPARWA